MAATDTASSGTTLNSNGNKLENLEETNTVLDTYTKIKS